MKFGTVTHVRWAEAASLAASSLGFIVAEHFVETFHVASNQALQLAGVDTARRKAPVARFTLLARSGVRPNACSACPFENFEKLVLSSAFSSSLNTFPVPLNIVL